MADPVQLELPAKCSCGMTTAISRQLEALPPI
jgi:hypothetical protein